MNEQYISERRRRRRRHWRRNGSGTDGFGRAFSTTLYSDRVVAHAESRPAIDPFAPPSFLSLLLTSLANVATEQSSRRTNWVRFYFCVHFVITYHLGSFLVSKVYQKTNNSGSIMAHRSEHYKAIFLLWCVSGIAFSITVPSPISRQVDEQRYTTRRTPKVYVEMPTPRTRLPLVPLNSELKTTTSVPSTTSTTHRSFSTEKPLYRLDRSNGQACILLQVDAIISVTYRTKLGEDESVDIYVPDDATVTGNCDNENTVTMSLKWNAFVLSWSFAKTPGGERWYVEKIELTYNSSDKHFEHIDQPNKTIRLSTGQKHSPMLFPTPVGKSYACSEETEIPLTDGKNRASVLLRDMKLQPFKFKNNEFAAEFSCTSLSARAARDETAPVAVGSTLAAAVLLTITGYAAYRYFKVKKVKYDTME